MPEKSENQHPTFITLVHGTWARGASWCKPDSKLCSVISSTIEGPIIYNIFNWSGLNFHKSRVQAGDDLANSIKEIAKIHPGHKHFIIGHSHGGNVIRYAMSTPGVADEIQGAVLLGTPYITIEPRDFHETLRKFMIISAVQAAAMSVLLVFIGIVAGAAYLSNGNSKEFSNFMRPFRSYGVISLVVFPIAGAIFYGMKTIYLERLFGLLGKWNRALYVRQFQIISGTAPPKIEGIPLYSITALSDEAGIILRFARGSTEWMLTGITSTIFKITIMIVAIPAAMAALLGVNYVQYGDWNDFTDTWAACAVVSLFFSPIAYLIALIPTVYFPRIYRTRIFGDDKMLDHLIVSTATQERPIGWHPNKHSSPNLSRWENLKTLLHSRVYDDELIIQGICLWLQARIADIRTESIKITRTSLSSEKELNAHEMIERVENFFRRK